jgi:hypothetical protein
MLPENDIHIDDRFKVTYGMVSNEPLVRNNKVGGYFVGSVHGLGEQDIVGAEYKVKGDLNIDNMYGKEFLYQISSSTINEIMEALLGSNTIQIPISNAQINASGFPGGWTTTQLEGIVPGICNVVGYDKPLKVIFKNKGAPKFLVRETEMSKVVYSMIMEVSGDTGSDVGRVVDIHFENLETSFKFQSKTMSTTIEIVWDYIKLESARVVPYVSIPQKSIDNTQHILDYFNWTFSFIVPWANINKPLNVTMFSLPTEFPGLLRFERIIIQIKDNYISFALNPTFLM